jgi:hypothetical protein
VNYWVTVREGEREGRSECELLPCLPYLPCLLPCPLLPSLLLATFSSTACPALLSALPSPPCLPAAVCFRVVVADLLLGGKSHGPHAFLLPLRTEQDGPLARGVTVGDMGPKTVGNDLDNAWVGG